MYLIERVSMGKQERKHEQGEGTEAEGQADLLLSRKPAAGLYPQTLG